MAQEQVCVQVDDSDVGDLLLHFLLFRIELTGANGDSAPTIVDDTTRLDGCDTRIAERALVELAENRMVLCDLYHLWIEIDEGHLFDVGVLENLTQGKAVSPSEDQDTPMVRHKAHDRMNQLLVVDHLIQRRELCVPVNVEAVVPELLILRDHQVLVGCRLAPDDLVFEEPLLHRNRPPHHAVEPKQHGEHRSTHSDDRCRAKTDDTTTQEVRDGNGSHDEVEAGHNEGDLRHRKVTEENLDPYESSDKGADVVHTPDDRHIGLEREAMLLVDTHDQRNLETDEETNHGDGSVEGQVEVVGQVAVGSVDSNRSEATEERHGDFDANELLHEELVREPLLYRPSDAHHEQHERDDHAVLLDGVAEDVGCHRCQNVLIDEPAGASGEHTEAKKRCRPPHVSGARLFTGGI